MAPAFRVREIVAGDDARWNDFVASHPEGNSYYHSGWLAVLDREYASRQVHLVCEDEAGGIHGILALVYTRGLPLRLGGPARGRRLASLPRTPVGGPLATSAAAAECLITNAVERVRAEPGTLLQIRRMRADLDGLVDGVVGRAWRPNYMLQLPPPGEELSFGDARNRAAIRRAVKKAEREGVRVRRAELADLRVWYRLYLGTMRRHLVPPRSLRFFEALLESPELAGVVELDVAEIEAGRQRRLIAGSFLFRFGTTVSYAFNGADPESFRLRPNDMLQWHAIEAARRDGYRAYDLGEVTGPNDPLSQFKRKWGASPEMMFRYYYPALGSGEKTRRPKSVANEKPMRLATAVWNRLPLRATAMIGAAAWKYL